MRRNIRLDIEYEGTDFSGWQRQGNRPTIQAVLEDAVAIVLNRRVTLYGASRTDAGVHAAGQVANFYLEARDPCFGAEKWRVILNQMLPGSIRITGSSSVSQAFHAQRGVVSKRYSFRILHREYPSALDRRVFFYPHRLDWKAIDEALPMLVGKKDFKAFQVQGGQRRTTEREITRIERRAEAPDLWRFEIEGTGFLKQMIRSLMGTLVEIGEGKRKPGDIPLILASRCRSRAGRTLPPAGLCLESVRYSSDL